MQSCDMCLYFEYDEDYGAYVCSMELDEDEAEKFMTGNNKACPFYTPGDEYTIVKKQN